jgi:hypothetical protein
MSFVECVTENATKKGLKSELRQQVIDAYQKAYLEASGSKGLTGVEAEIYAQDIAKNFIQNIESSARNKVKGLLKQKELDRVIDNLDPKMSLENKIEQIYQAAAHRGEAITNQIFRMMGKDLKKFAPQFFETARDHQAFKEVLRKAYNKDFTGELGPAAKSFVDANEYMWRRFNNAGGVMGKIDNYLLPQVHSKEALMGVRTQMMKDQGLNLELAQARLKKEWVEQVSRDADIFDMNGNALSLEKKVEILNTSFEDIMSDGLYSQRKKFEAGEEIAMGFGDIDQRRNRKRVIHFKNFDLFDNYNKKFGLGDEGIVQHWANHVKSMSTDIGILEQLGPRPTSLSKHFDNKMRLYGNSPNNRKWVNGQFQLLKGIPSSSGVDSLPWRIVTGVQNLMRASMLGAASLSAVSDTAFGYATAKMNGLSGARTLKLYTQKLFGAGELEDIASRAGFVSKVINGSVLSDTRFAGDMSKQGVTAWLAGLTNKASGLARMTEAMKDGIALEFMGTIADQVGSKKLFKDLDKDFQDMLLKGGLESGDWDNVVSKADIQDYSGAKFVFINELRVKEIDGSDARVVSGVADKLDDIVYKLRQQATNEATLATRAMTTGAAFGDGSAGSLSRMFASSVFMFKSFPITVMMTHIMPAIRRANLDSATKSAFNLDFKGAGKQLTQGRFDHIGATMIGTTLLGAVAMHLKELSKGKTPQDMDNYQFWQAAFLQGGGLGLFGDFLLNDYSRFGRDPVADITGPFGGLVSDIFNATKGNFDRNIDGKDPNFQRDMFRILKRNTPMQSLWYTRLAMDRLLMDNVERYIDPKFDKRMRMIERKMKKEKGQEFWWGPE